jgi:NitT/TauT family transport system substrate-binding protein
MENPMEKKQQYILGAIIVILILVIAGAYVIFSGQTAAAAGATAGTAAGSTANETTVRLGYLPSNGDGLFFIAKEEGYFDQQGLNVQFSQFTDGADAYNAMLANKIDIAGAGTSDPLTFIAKGAPLTVIGGLMSEGQMFITTPQNAQTLSNLSNWKGKTIAGVVMSNGDLVFRFALHDQGIDWQHDVNFLEFDSPTEVIEAVKSGKADGGIVFIPFEQVAQQEGLVVPIYTAQLWPKHPCCRIVAETQYIDNNRETTVKFEKALIEAYKFWNENHDKTADDIQKYVQLDKGTILNSTYNNYFYSSPDPNSDGVRQFWQKMNDAGYINSTIDINQHIDTSVYKQALTEVISENPNDTFYQGLLSDYNQMNS